MHGRISQTVGVGRRSLPCSPFYSQLLDRHLRPPSYTRARFETLPKLNTLTRLLSASTPTPCPTPPPSARARSSRAPAAATANWTMPPPAAWQPARARVQLKLSRERLRLLQQKKTQMAKQTRREVAALLDKGKLESARIKVEGLLAEDLYVELLEVLEL